MESEIKINASDIDFLIAEFELKSEIAKSYMIKAKGDLDLAIDLVTTSTNDSETKYV